jgi:hypothetical protein
MQPHFRIVAADLKRCGWRHAAIAAGATLLAQRAGQ